MPKALSLLAALLPAALLVSGCSGSERDPPGAGTTGDGEGPAEDGALPLPDWAVGDYWTYTFNGQPTTYIVAGETASDWLVETDSAERSFADTQDDVSRLGPQRKSDLAGSQGEDRVQFFRWPLRLHDNWTTRWDGQDVSIRVVALDGDQATLEARAADSPAGGDPLYRYVYDAKARNLSELTRHPADGGEVVRLQLAASGQAWKGNLVRWELATLVDASGVAEPMLGFAEPDLVVPDGTTDLWLRYDFTCAGDGGYTLVIRAAPPAQGGHESSDQCVGPLHFEDVIVAAPAPGTWTMSLALGGGPEPPTYEVRLLARTRVDVPFG